MTGRADYRRGQFSLAELQGKQLYFLLDLSLGGQLIRLSSKDIIAPGGEHDNESWGWDGELVQYYGGLEFDEQVQDPLALLSDAPDQKTVSLTLHLWPQWDVSKMVANGVMLGAGRASLYLWAEGSIHRIRLLEGRIRNPVWDLPERPLVVTLEEDPVQDLALWPAVNNRVFTNVFATLGTFISASKMAVHQYYPTVFGSPGKLDEYSGSPGLYVDTPNSILMIAGHPVLAARVQIYDATDDQADSFAVEQGYDLLHQRYSYVTLASAGSFVDDPTHEYWVRWEQRTLVTTPQYGLPADDPEQKQGMRGAGDILIYWLRQSNIIWDEGRLNVIRPLLNAYRIDTYAMSKPSERLLPYEWITANLLPILPLSPRIGPGGLHYILWPFTLDRTASVANLVAGSNCEQDSAVETSNIDDVINTFIFNYRKDMATGEFLERFIVTGNPDAYVADEEAGTPVIPSLYGKRSIQAYGEERVSEIDVEIVEDSGTMGLIAAWMIRAAAVQWYTMSYLVDQETATAIKVGDVVSLLDDDRGFKVEDGSGRVAMVSMVTYTVSGMWAIGLRLPTAEFGNPA